ncbi:hypothetical protein, conserved [Plasmodium gonderi]|uniref:Variable surface protein n=1 Tax=Plasmodium gonderi TaxID=77519 RepID=A0A1Y1JPX5_PLAGO|nr:hypothetical protein, conserved [Plasmodium gonderi]GAW82892.1 hypothetical protein, conserved [Plasmodium gonderi]
MNLYLLLLNCLIFGNLRGSQSRSTINNEDTIGVSEEAIKKLKEIKKLELDILNDFVKKDTTHADIYKRYHCIASDYISYDSKSTTEFQKNSNTRNGKSSDVPRDIKTNEQNLNEKGENSKSFVEKIMSFVGIFNYNNVSNIFSEQDQKIHQRIKIDGDGNGSESTNKEEKKAEITKNKNPNSYMQLSSSLSLTKRNMFLGGKENSSEHFEVGNLGSFYMIFGARNTDYPWACTCDPLQLIDYKEKKRNYVLCSNQVDMSIQNSDLFCNPKNSSRYFYLSYIFMFLIVIVCF